MERGFGFIFAVIKLVAEIVLTAIWLVTSITAASLHAVVLVIVHIAGLAYYGYKVVTNVKERKDEKKVS